MNVFRSRSMSSSDTIIICFEFLKVHLIVQILTICRVKVNVSPLKLISRFLSFPVRNYTVFETDVFNNLYSATKYFINTWFIEIEFKSIGLCSPFTIEPLITSLFK